MNAYLHVHTQTCTHAYNSHKYRKCVHVCIVNALGFFAMFYVEMGRFFVFFMSTVFGIKKRSLLIGKPQGSLSESR